MLGDRGAVFEQAKALSGAALARRRLGDYAGARRIHEDVLDRTRELGIATLAWIQMANLGNIAFELGDYVAAVEWHEEAVTACRAVADVRGLALSLGNLAEACRELGDVQSALRYADEALALNRERGYKRGEAHVQDGRGRVFLAAAALDEARGAFRHALAIWDELALRVPRLETLAGLALAEAAAGDAAAAAGAAAAAIAGLADDDHPPLRQNVLHAAGMAAAAEDQPELATRYLVGAAEAMVATAAALAEDERAVFLERAGPNRRLRAALAEHGESRSVLLARASVPLGRALATEDFIEVRWTVRAADDETVGAGGPRRRHVLMRLLREAAEQSASPTDDDLATALGVSRRTILRDMQVLATAGEHLRSRRRKPKRE
jgi:tetratricopeptide (TPR) repeat protein/biotin operon repressor